MLSRQPIIGDIKLDVPCKERDGDGPDMIIWKAGAEVFGGVGRVDCWDGVRGE